MPGGLLDHVEHDAAHVGGLGRQQLLLVVADGSLGEGRLGDEGVREAALIASTLLR